MYTKIRYKEVYDGIDLLFYGDQEALEYDIILKPGSRVEDVVFSIEGAKDVKVIENGDLEITFPSGDKIIHKKPNAYQEIEGEKREVESGFKVEKKDNIYLLGYNIREYDKMIPLIIDPLIISYSTYLGGSGEDEVAGIILDNSGNIYLTGITTSADFPVTPGAYDTSFNGGWDAFLVKISSSGALLYSTYLGGSGEDEVAGIILDNSGNIYLTGTTGSDNF